MSGSYIDAAADTIAADAAAIAAGVSAALAATQQGQMQSAAFIVEHGGEVVAGHADTSGPGGAADSGIAGAPVVSN